MSDEVVILRARTEKNPDANLLPEMTALVARGLMEPELEVRAGAERSTAREIRL